MNDYRPRVLVDFDGVLHTYDRGWHDGTVYGGPMPGALDAIGRLREEGYEVVVFSTRDAAQVAAALDRWGFPKLEVTDRKLPAVALIDDRAIRFLDWTQVVRELLGRYPVHR